jgi:hypothetical protein
VPAVALCAPRVVLRRGAGDWYGHQSDWYGYKLSAGSALES